MKKLDGKIAIISGGAGGIGKGMATAFVKEGATVVIIDLNAEVGNQTIKELQEYQPNFNVYSSKSYRACQIGRYR